MQHNSAIVLGASGFIGTRLVKHLVGRGATSVRALDIEPARERLDGVEYKIHDIREPIPKEYGIGGSIVYNLAAVHRTPGHADWEYFEYNVSGALNAVAFADACDIRTIVFTSSIAVYGPSEETVLETSPLRPTSSYGRSKRLAERVHEQWLRQGNGRRLIVLRPGVIFGPGERGNYTRLAKALRKGYFVYPGRRDTIKSGGYVDELLRSMEFAVDRDDTYILYNFAYPDLSTTEDIVKAFASVTGTVVRPPTLPIAPLRAASYVLEAANALGVSSPINYARVLKLTQSTRVAPGWLQANNYRFSTSLRTALESWRDETDGRFD